MHRQVCMLLSVDSHTHDPALLEGPGSACSSQPQPRGARVLRRVADQGLGSKAQGTRRQLKRSPGPQWAQRVTRWAQKDRQDKQQLSPIKQNQSDYNLQRHTQVCEPALGQRNRQGTCFLTARELTSVEGSGKSPP